MPAWVRAVHLGLYTRECRLALRVSSTCWAVNEGHDKAVLIATSEVRDSCILTATGAVEALLAGCRRYTAYSKQRLTPPAGGQLASPATADPAGSPPQNRVRHTVSASVPFQVRSSYSLPAARITSTGPQRPVRPAVMDQARTPVLPALPAP